MPPILESNEVFGLVRPTVDAHTLGVSYVAKLLRGSGYRTVIAQRDVTDAVNNIFKPGSSAVLTDWILAEGITRLGLSYRLDPADAAVFFGRVRHQLADRNLLGNGKGNIRCLYFAGLPEACNRIFAEYGGEVPVFRGDESPVETLQRLGVPPSRIPASISKHSLYDDQRMEFAHELVASEEYQKLLPENRSGYFGFGTRADHVVKRIDHAGKNGQGPLMRVHVGPYNPDRKLALAQFHGWLAELSRSGFLDIVSIGTSQLTQERFGEDWGDCPNGGGVPVNSPEEYRAIWDAARPMLVRTYAGTRNIPYLARVHEDSLNIAWHALSFWWFSQIDGRGPHRVLDNLREHLETLDFIAGSGKPFEPNIPHHFAFRGADDVSYVVSALIAAHVAKRKGIRYFILQNMLNTPRYTWGVQDLAKSRAMLRLLRELEDSTFRVFLQPRAGLDYFSPDLDKAKAQLASVSALMDDIEPFNFQSPDIIHVVSYSEASHLADPAVIDESIRITRAAILDYRKLRRKGLVRDMSHDEEVVHRTESLVCEARTLMSTIERLIPNWYSAEGLNQILAAGFLPVPYLWECRVEFANAISWSTDIVDGGVALVDKAGETITASQRVQTIESLLANLPQQAKINANV
jgi:hypothetical protein